MALRPIVVSEKTDECPLRVAGRVCFVTVRQISPAHDKELRAKAVVKKRDEQTLREFEAFDADLYSVLFFRAAIASLEDRAGWRGVTPDILAMLVELPDGYEPTLVKETRPRADGSGADEIDVVAYNAELAEFLWQYAPPALFQNPIFTHAQNVLITTQLRKEAERGNWSGSPAA